MVASLLCAAAPNIELLIAGRTLQGFTAAAGMVSAMAIARDVSNGAAMARLFAALMLVTGAAPVIAPVLGGQLLLVTSWRGIFGLLAVAGLLLLLTATFRVPETLPVERRRVGGFGETFATFRRLVRDPGFRTPLLAMVLSCAGLFGYLAGSPFLLQDVHGLSAQAYSALFAVNTIGLTGLSQVSGRIVHRTGPRVLLLAGTSICAHRRAGPAGRHAGRRRAAGDRAARCSWWSPGWASSSRTPPRSRWRTTATPRARRPRCSGRAVPGRRGGRAAGRARSGRRR